MSLHNIRAALPATPTAVEASRASPANGDGGGTPRSQRRTWMVPQMADNEDDSPGEDEGLYLIKMYFLISL
jgi:hypothetical protein